MAYDAKLQIRYGMTCLSKLQSRNGSCKKTPKVVKPFKKVSVRNRFIDMWTYFYSLKVKL